MLKRKYNLFVEGKNDQWPFKIVDTIFRVGSISSEVTGEQRSILSFSYIHPFSGMRVASLASGLATYVCSYVI